MEIHRYEKAWFAVSLLLIVGFIATITYGAVGAGVQMISDDGGTIDPDNIEEHEDFADGPGVEHVGGAEYEASVIAVQFAFSPDPIEVPEGGTVTFHVSSADVIRGFSIVGTNVNTMVIPGQVSEVTARFDEPGTYGLVCHEYCGAAHHEMGGSIEVVPQSDYTYNDTEVDG
jgi:cytochrome c oxidase subunit 2